MLVTESSHDPGGDGTACNSMHATQQQTILNGLKGKWLEEGL